MVPRGTFALAHDRPPCASIVERQIDSPNPKPLGLVEQKAAKRGFRDSGARPGRFCQLARQPMIWRSVADLTGLEAGEADRIT